MLTEALSILDQYGLADLTMRRLASNLGVQPGALYWHFANKQTLLDAVAAEILAGLPQLRGGDWATAVKLWAARLHALLRAHRSGAEVVSGALALRPWEESPAAMVAAYLTERGIESDTARAFASGLLHLVLGHAAWEEQAAQLAELGIKEGGLPSDSTALLDDAVAMLTAGLGTA